MEDKDRTKSVYFVRVAEPAKEKGILDKMAFWRSDDNAKPKRYQVTVYDDNENSIVSANNDKGESNSASQQIVEVLYQNLTRK